MGATKNNPILGNKNFQNPSQEETKSRRGKWLIWASHLVAATMSLEETVQGLSPPCTLHRNTVFFFTSAWHEILPMKLFGKLENALSNWILDLHKQMSVQQFGWTVAPHLRQCSTPEPPKAMC